MAITSIKTGSSFTNLQKYNDFLGPNAAYDPGATWLIERVTPTSGTSVTFSSIPSTYKNLQLRMKVNTSSTGDTIYIRLNGDTGTNYTRHYLQGNGTTATAVGNTGRSYMQVGGWSTNTANTTISCCIISDLIDYANTSKYKTLRTSSGIDKNGTGDMVLASNLWISTAAVSSITVALDTNSFASGTSIALYGMVG